LTPLWIDTDIALGAPQGDVDDGFALAALLCAARAGDARVAGISTVFGNTSAAQAEACAQRLCEAVGVPVSIVRGGQRRSQWSPAAEHLAALPEGAEVLALGPLTNIAAASRADAGFASRVSLRVVGGHLSSRGFLPPLWPFEFNLARDQAAAREVFSVTWRRLILYPLDVVSRLRANRRRLAALARLSPLGAFLAEGSGRWLARARWRHLSRSFPLWDLPAALDALGLLPGERELVKIASGSARFFRNTAPVFSVVSFDSTEAWEGFERLIRNHPVPHVDATDLGR